MPQFDITEDVRPQATIRPNLNKKETQSGRQLTIEDYIQDPNEDEITKQRRAKDPQYRKDETDVVKE